MSALLCFRCSKLFQGQVAVAYCPDCVAWFRGERAHLAELHNPVPGMMLDGKFREPAECPASLHTAAGRACGLCGSENVADEYGLGTGYGLGGFARCWDCGAVMDFRADDDEDE